MDQTQDALRVALARIATMEAALREVASGPTVDGPTAQEIARRALEWEWPKEGEWPKVECEDPDCDEPLSHPRHGEGS
jgi:hypothetical protein